MKIPKIEGIELIAWRSGFALSPTFAEDRVVWSTFALGKVTANAPEPFRSYFEGKPCWEICHWVSFEEGDDDPVLDFSVLLDPEVTEESARNELEKTSTGWTDENLQAMAKLIKPEVEVMKVDKSKVALEDLFRARMEVLKDATPKTVALVMRAAEATDAKEREKLNDEAVQCYFAELAALWQEKEIKAWFERNPLGRKWILEFAKCFYQGVRQIDEVNYELALNWIKRSYDRMTPEQLSEAVYEATGERLSPDAIRKRHYRKLGLMTKRPAGQPQKSN